ncbi:MAG: hypothetical protein D6678_07445 [Zetaproteobacteria bacterium]|nr:MAG: hypothetical protein D6678_07445 [Zetaproteobacteria bacterium]
MLLLLLCLGCTQQPAPSPATTASPVVAVVGGVPIHASDIDYELSLLPASLRDMRDRRALRDKVLEAIARRYVLSRKAVEEGLDLDPTIRREIRRAREEILIRALRFRHMRDMPEPDASEIRAYYIQHRARYTRPPLLHLRHIVCADAERARMVYEHLRRKPEDFAMLAAMYSLDAQTKTHGGDLNWLPPTALAPALADAVAKLKSPHELSPPVHTRFGWHVVELLARKPGQSIPLDQVRAQVIADMRHDAWRQWVEQQLAATPIKRMAAAQ